MKAAILLFKSSGFNLHGVAIPMKALWVILMLGLTLGCAETRMEHRQPTADDPPFGGGFEASRRTDYREPPFDPNSRRTELRPVWRGDNGAPETRTNTGGSPAGGSLGGPDARIDRRTQ